MHACWHGTILTDMSGILQSDIFFFITSVAVVVVAIFAVIVLVYIVRILKNIKDVSDIIKKESMFIAKDIGVLRGAVVDGTAKAGRMLGRLITPKKERKGKKKNTKIS